MLALSRRNLLKLGTLGLGASALGYARASHATADIALPVGATTAEIMPSLQTAAMMGYGTAGPSVLHLTQGQHHLIHVQNQLEEVTTVHWHGLRGPNAEDGVPYLTQLPIGVSEDYTYDLLPKDAGTFWFHPHCNTLEQIARGLAGVVVVHGPDDAHYDADEVIQLRDFRLGKDGQFIEFTKPRNAVRGGTLGTVTTANWQTDLQINAPAGGLLRLRLAVTDVTRVFQIAVTGAEARVIAADGHPVPMPYEIAALPTQKDRDPVAAPGTWPVILAPGQRTDLAIVMPAAGGVVTVEMALPGGVQKTVATLHATGPNLGRTVADILPLTPNPLSQPDLATAEHVDFTIGWSPSGTAGTGGICGDTPYRFWSINRKLWPGEGAPDPANPLAPLAELKLGKSYIFRMKNETHNDHPIHLHGMAFKLLSSNQRPLPPHWTDTALLRADETVEVAFVADNPGDWVFHCHVIEHQKSGLAGLIRVA
jgi:FtsP/CotA-like multicopper oxidase with cupredoxin domain